MRTIIEPFRIKSVEPIRMTTRAERERAGIGGVRIASAPTVLRHFRAHFERVPLGAAAVAAAAGSAGR